MHTTLADLEERMQRHVLQTRVGSMANNGRSFHRSKAVPSAAAAAASKLWAAGECCTVRAMTSCCLATAVGAAAASSQQLVPPPQLLEVLTWPGGSTC